MTDFTELEAELKKLRPVSPSAGIASRIESALAADGSDPAKIIVPARFRLNWRSIGLGLAAAATFRRLARNDFRARNEAPQKAFSPTPATQLPTAPLPLKYRAADLTQVLYHERDEGLVYPTGLEEPVRRVRIAKRETLRWDNPQTGAQLRVSYPAEEVTLTPISGQ
jgi:hypothetical protein